METEGNRGNVRERQQSTGTSIVKLITPHVAGSNPALATNIEGRKALISFELALIHFHHIQLSIHQFRFLRQG